MSLWVLNIAAFLGLVCGFLGFSVWLWMQIDKHEDRRRTGNGKGRA